MPSESPKEIADKALVAATVAARAAEKAAHAAERARTVAEIAKNEALGLRTEMRERFDRQDRESREFREALMKEIIGQNRTFDAFKSDFNEVELRSVDNADRIHGNKKKNIIGIIPVQQEHETFKSRVITQFALVASLITLFGGYMLAFHLEDMKRGFFRPTEEEQVRVINRQIFKMVPTAKWPDPNAALKPSTPNGT